MEFQIADRISFMAFLNLEMNDRVLDEKNDLAVPRRTHKRRVERLIKWVLPVNFVGQSASKRNLIKEAIRILQREFFLQANRIKFFKKEDFKNLNEPEQLILRGSHMQMFEFLH